MVKHECSVPICESVRNKTSKNISYFKFPTNPTCLKVWAKLISRQQKNGELWMPPPNARICSLHFVKADFRHWATYKRLLPNALPSVFPGYPPKLLKRQAKIIANFRKNNPLGEETTEEPPSSPRRTRKTSPMPTEKNSGESNDDEQMTQKKNVDKSNDDDDLTTQKKDSDKSNDDDQMTEDKEDELYDSYRSSSVANHDSEEPKTVENTDGPSNKEDTSGQRLSTEDLNVSEYQSEESKPLKKRKIEANVRSNGDDESERLSDEKPLQSRNQTASSGTKNVPKTSTPAKNRQSNGDGTQVGSLIKKSSKMGNYTIEVGPDVNIFEQTDDETLGRGMRLRKRTVKLEIDPEEPKSVDDDQEDEECTPEQSSMKRPGKTQPSGKDGYYTPDESSTKQPAKSQPSEKDGYYTPDESSTKRPAKSQPGRKIIKRQSVEDNSEESRHLRHNRRLMEQIRWKDERLVNLNQKAFDERNARLKAEKELETLRNLMKSKSLVVPAELSTSTNRSDVQRDDPDGDVLGDSRLDQEEIISNKGSDKLNWIQTINNLKQEIILKDQLVADLKNNENNNVETNSNTSSKNRFTQIMKRILEDAMKNDAKALFLLEQLEAYGKDEVTNFRMSTIKKCVEWKLLNTKGYEAVRNMGILTLPTSKILRKHVDFMADNGVTATERVSFESDLAELTEENAEDELPTEVLSNKTSLGKKRAQILRKGAQCRTMADEDRFNGNSTEPLQRIIGQARQRFKRELTSSSPMEGEHSMDQNAVENCGMKHKGAAVEDESGIESVMRMSQIIWETKKRLKGELPSSSSMEGDHSRNVKLSEKNGAHSPMKHKRYRMAKDEDVSENDSVLDTPQIIRKTKKKVKVELPSSSSIEGDQSDSAGLVHRIVGQPAQPFQMELPSGILIKEVMSLVKNLTSETNASLKKEDIKTDEDCSKELVDEIVEEYTAKEELDYEVGCSTNKTNARSDTMKTSSKNVIIMEEDPTSENLVGDANDMTDPASEDFMMDANSAEVAGTEEELLDGDMVEPASEDIADPPSEDMRDPASEDIAEPRSEDMIEYVSEDMAESADEGNDEPDTQSSDLREKTGEEGLAPGGFIEEVCFSDDYDST